MKKVLLILPLLSLLFSVAVLAQAPQGWHMLSPEEGYPGVSATALYERLGENAQGETVVVAVLDSGVDYEHEDLASVMWVNEDEIPDNGIDDDRNGYVDDIHGWNFLGNSDGSNVEHDNLEVTRIYRRLSKKYADADPEELSKKEKEEYKLFQETKKTVEDKRSSLQQNAQMFSGLQEATQQLKELIGKDTITAEDLDELETDDPRLMRVAQVLGAQMSQGMNFEQFQDEINQAADYYNGQYEYYYNVDFDPRNIVNDDYSDKEERIYGNNDVRGPDADHGTHVAGIIAAERGNDIGIDGVAANVRIMSVRCVPDGDERDKDVANAIRYAVDNGASIINMSFGKGYSPYKKVVDDAVKYAKKNDVLLIHAAGNDGAENDNTNNYPNDKYEKRGFFGLGAKKAKNWMEVGALNYETGESLPAPFSNYSVENVDVFAPGNAIYSTVVGDKYDSYPGTSMAAPMVAGIAAVLRSYFPDMKAEEVKEILMTSTIKKGDQEVEKPGTGDLVPFSSLSVTGGMINLERAVEEALRRSNGKGDYLKRLEAKKKTVTP